MMPETESSSSRGIIVTAVAVVSLAAVGQYLYMRKRQDNKKDRQKQAQGESWSSHVKPHRSLQEVWPNTLFVLEADGCDRGPPVRNMVIYRIPSTRKLVIYNGIAVEEPTMSAILKLGTPTVLVVPNGYHRCCVAVYKARFPGLLVTCPEVALEAVQQVVQVDFTTQEWSKIKDWSDWITTRNLDGMGDYETSILEFKLQQQPLPKKALVVCDLLFAMPYDKNTGFMDRLMLRLFDCAVEISNNDNDIVIPKVARVSRIFGIRDWPKVEAWYRSYACHHGRSIGAIVVGHGVPIVEVDPEEGCTKALEGVADQLKKPQW